MDKIIYHFDPATGEFLHEGPVYFGPEGDEQIPAFATLTPPPELAEGFVAVVERGSLTAEHACTWSQVRDWRTTAIYRTADGSPIQAGAEALASWAGLGDLPSGITDILRPSANYVWSGTNWEFDLATAKVAKLAAIDEECAAREASPFEAGGHSFSADPVSIAAILSAGQIAGIAKVAERAYSTNLVAADGSEIELDVDGLVDLALALGAHQNACRQTAKQLRDAVSAAESEGALSAIGWPA